MWLVHLPRLIVSCLICLNPLPVLIYVSYARCGDALKINNRSALLFGSWRVSRQIAVGGKDPTRRWLVGTPGSDCLRAVENAIPEQLGGRKFTTVAPAEANLFLLPLRLACTNSQPVVLDQFLTVLLGFPVCACCRDDVADKLSYLYSETPELNSCPRGRGGG